MLKGGTSILARVPSTRTTRDIDLYRRGFTLPEALDDLLRLAALDLEDHFHFEYAGHTDSIVGDAQPYTEGCRVKFNVFVGVGQRGSLNVDLAVGGGMTGEVATVDPATSLKLGRLVNNPYRLYPTVDQIADKVCATMTGHSGRPSSREKDLIDLVVFAKTHDVDGSALHLAIATETRRRRLAPFNHFAVPVSWGAGYARLAKSVPYCADHHTVALAAELAARLVDPALTGASGGMRWSHGSLDWT